MDVAAADKQERFMVLRSLEDFGLWISAGFRVEHSWLWVCLNPTPNARGVRPGFSVRF